MRKKPDLLCLNCTLPLCDQDRGLPCRFLDTAKYEEMTERLREQKREHNARRRDERREEATTLRLKFSRLLGEYGTFGKHSDLIKAVRQYSK